MISWLRFHTVETYYIAQSNHVRISRGIAQNTRKRNLTTTSTSSTTLDDQQHQEQKQNNSRVILTRHNRRWMQTAQGIDELLNKLFIHREDVLRREFSLSETVYRLARFRSNHLNSEQKYLEDLNYYTCKKDEDNGAGITCFHRKKTKENLLTAHIVFSSLNFTSFWPVS